MSRAITTTHSYRECPWLHSGLGRCPRCRAAHNAYMKDWRAKRRALSHETSALAQSAMISGYLAEAA